MENLSIESEWVEKISNGDVSAFEDLVITYSEPLYRFAQRHVKDFHAAKDIVQDVFVQIWIHRNECTPFSNLRAYLFKSVRNKSLDFLKHAAVRRRNLEHLEVLYHASQTPDEDFIEKELTSAIQKAIEQLPERCNLIFTMKKYDGLSYSEIAEVLNISINTVQTQMGIAFKYLRKHLDHILSDHFI